MKTSTLLLAAVRSFNFHLPSALLPLTLLISICHPGITQTPVGNGMGYSTQYIKGMNVSPQNGNGFLGNTYIKSACGLNYVQASVKITNRDPVPVGVGLPATLTISGIPSGACIDQAYLYYTASTSSGNVAVSFTNPLSITTNYTASIIGTDGGGKCWWGIAKSYRVNVTASITGNGNYSVTMGVGVVDTDGATLFIIYTNPTAAYQGSLIIADGCIDRSAMSFSNLIAVATQTLTGFTVCDTPSYAEAFVIVSDMQVGASPTHQSTLNGVTYNFPALFWNFNQSPTTLTLGQTTAAFGVSVPYDCYAWEMMGLYYQTTTCAACPSSASVLTVTPSGTNASCGNCNGSAMVTASGGTAPYNYQWGTAAGNQTTQTATGLCAGTYSVTVTGAGAGCSSTSAGSATVTIPSTGGVSLSVSATQTSCTANNGTATATASGGSGNYTYLWSNGGTQSAISNLQSAIYTVTVTNANGCTAIQTVTVTAANNTLSVTATSTQTSCTANNGTATAVATGGNGSYTYIWSNNATTSSVSALGSGSYTITVTDANGCTSTQTVSVTAANNTLSVTATSTPDSCTANTGTATAAATGGSPQYTYLWNNGATPSAISNLPSGIYSVTVTDANGCTQTQTVNVSQIPGPTASATAAPSAITVGDSATLTATGGGTYSWSNGATTATVAVAPAVTTVYCVTVTAANNCTATACVTVLIIDPPCGAIYVPNVFAPPNAFTPNKDKDNEQLCAYGNCIKEIELIIYNRWGQKVFETTDISKCWDGTYKGKPLNTAVFVYYLKATLTTGEKITKKGNVSLLR